MKIFSSYEDTKDQQLRDWLYCGFDCCVTSEVHDAIYPLHTENQRRTSRFEHACQGPALSMQIRGIRIDDDKRKSHIKRLRTLADDRRGDLDAEAKRARGYGFKWGTGYSPPPGQLAKLFYEDLKFPKQFHFKTGKVTTDKKALEKLSKHSKKAKEIVETITTLRDSQKQIEVLEGGISPDGRFRFTMAVGQADTGRASSYSDPYGLGDNIQNKDQRLRDMFVADPGWVMCNADLEQAESRVIAYISGDEAYISAHEEGNVHVSSAQIFWPNFGWSRDSKENKDRLKYTPAPWIPQPKPLHGELPFYSYYDGSKRNQHGLNYGLTPFGLAIQAGIPRESAREYHHRYFQKFRRILDYHNFVKQELRTTATLTTPLGMEREFFNRPWEDHTIRQGIAFVPQSTVAQICWEGIRRVWSEFDPLDIQVLMNGHDSGLYQFKNTPAFAPTAPEYIKTYMTIPVPVWDFSYTKERIMAIPVEVGTGANWAECK
jgi:DNA polymerase I